MLEGRKRSGGGEKCGDRGEIADARGGKCGGVGGNGFDMVAVVVVNGWLCGLEDGV